MFLNMTQSIKMGVYHWAMLALMLLMAITRFHHFGTAFSLPDASLAVFFLAGLGLSGRYFFIALLVEAGLIDYFAISQLAVSDYCISPAYVFLIPTYVVMWFGGKLCSNMQNVQITNLIKQFSLLVFCTLVAFFISNTSFFLISDQVMEMTWQHYMQTVRHYLPAYLISTLLYVTVIYALFTVSKKSMVIRHNQQIL